MAWNSLFVGKITENFSPIFPLSLLEVSRVVVGVEAPGGASGNFQSLAGTINLHGCSTSGALATEAQWKNKKNKAIPVKVWTCP
jgi:hypothetical protein